MSLSNNFPTIKPSLLLDFANTKQLDPRITFTRTSTATYYDGVTTAMAEQNLLTYSQEFDNAAWTKTGATITANSTTAPDGTATAETLNEGISTNYHSAELAISTVLGQTYTFSTYAKNNSGTYVNLSFYNNTTGNLYAAAIFNLSTGTITSSGAVGAGYSVVSSSITENPFGSGWYRCSITVTNGSGIAANRVITALNDTGTIGSYGVLSYTGTSRSIYIWGAQLEQRSTATAYTATTTQPITNYIPVLLTAASGIPRFNHNPTTGESLGLLIEEQRTNLLTYSEQFDNAVWTKAQATVTANAIIAPDGTLTADLVSPTAVTLNHGVFRTVSVSAGAYTISGYAKAQGASKVLLYGGATGYGFDLSNGTMSAVTGISAAQAYSITESGNGWYRCSITVAAAPTEATFLILETFASMSYAGNVNSGIYIWGAQLEAGTVATSYIPTVAATVTRSADSASMTGTNFSSWYRPDEGTLFAHYDQNSSTQPGGSLFVQSDGTNNNRILLTADGSGSGNIQPGLYVTDTSTAQVLIVAGIGTINSTNKLAAAYKTNDFAASFNGAASVTDLVGTVPFVNRSYIGAGATGTSALINNNIRRIAYYPVRLTNAQLQALTTV